MEGPGMSLFQGAASIHINNSAQDRLEEQEELEDQKRRNEELKHKLANAFDDLLDDDEASSVNSSGNFTLDATQTNGPQPRTGLPPTYIESLNHLKEQASESPKAYCETPKNHLPHLRLQEEPVKLQFSPYGAGDGQNHYYQQDFRGHVNGINNYDARQEYMNNDQLKVMYEMRVKECQQLAGQMEKLDSEIEGLRARLAAALADRDKAELSLQEAHHILASSKHKLIELEQQVQSLTEKLVESDQEKEQMKMELRSANISLQDVQQRLHTMQVAHTHDTDALFREQQDRHRDEMDRLQNDLMKAKGRLDDKDNEIKNLERRCKEREKEKEELLIEKGATINRLARELEEAQGRLAGGEGARARERAAHLAAERNAARDQVKELGSKLEVTAHELVLARGKLAGALRDHEQWRAALHQLLADAAPDHACIAGEPPSPGKLTTLKEVLNRYKVQIQKMSSLQEEINKRDRKLEQHRKQESELRATVEEQKGIEMQLSSRLAVLQNKLELLGASSDGELLDTYKQQNEHLKTELDDVRAELKNVELKYTELEWSHDKLKSSRERGAGAAHDAHAELLRELERCGARLKDALAQNGDLKTLYLQACSSRDSTTRELKDLKAKIEKERELFKCQEKEHVETIERHKQHVERLTAELCSARAELQAANTRISELQREFTHKQKEFTAKLDKYLHDEKNAMRKEMESCAACEKQARQIKLLDEQLGKYTVKLASQESNEALMKELKNKAEFFQQYIMDRFKKLHEQRSVGTNTEETASVQKTDSGGDGAHDSDDAMADKTALMMKEKAIRDQIAEKFTLEMKTMEMNCIRKIKEIESEQTEAITKLKELLERKAQEVETLKDFIISERAKVTQILESKESEISELIKEHNQVQAEWHKAKDCAQEWKIKADKYKERASRLGSLEDVLKSERPSCKECQGVRAKLAELQASQAKLEKMYEKLQTDHQTVQDKYRTAKKTIFTYKDYISKKDLHVNNEMGRIQEEYRKIFVKMQNQVNYSAQCRRQDARAGHLPPADVSERLNKLNDDIARLAQDNFTEAPDINNK